ncbi:hypothetical protein SETIT_2G059500v2 [Setaria italica]|uniref:Uncharacterized protein n=2 Tax=Setaria TaxID=4554 RepID=A0A368PVY4_SETIT|nr:hypothetical protein SETIT_2G059500v2 [Setaria italica]TKW30813.1 hypothetical protein SEVIR_2G062600v2 [Setaria viridis]
MAAANTDEVKMMSAPETGEGKKRTKLVRVKQEYIDWILVKRKVLPRRPFPSLSDEVLDGVFRAKPELRERLRRDFAECAALMKKIHDDEDDILEQYHAKGYAMQEIEIRDDEGEVAGWQLQQRRGGSCGT